jgi:hypothetical protein
VDLVIRGLIERTVTAEVLYPESEERRRTDVFLPKDRKKPAVPNLTCLAQSWPFIF